MTTWLDGDTASISRYLLQLRLRSASSPIYYRQTLHSFREIVLRLGTPASEITREVLETWLHERLTDSAVCTVLHRSRIVNRFLMPS